MTLAATRVARGDLRNSSAIDAVRSARRRFVARSLEAAANRFMLCRSACRRALTVVSRRAPHGAEADPSVVDPSMEKAMTSQPFHCTLAGCAAFAVAVLASSTVLAAEPDSRTTPNTPRIMLAQAAPASSRAARPIGDAYPAYQRGVRAAAAEGPDALRRYVWRTRMIYNFYYYDFVTN
jgi:hypothetical protein